ncbi:MAG: hypothetical protein HFJ41_04465 [Clostridia bacterium]|nr:hypothetical protein [Clostridia bacterium]
MHLSGDKGINSEEYKSLKFDVGAIINRPLFEETTQHKNNIEQTLNWQYKYKQSENIPTKTSVSEIKNRKDNVGAIINRPLFEETLQMEVVSCKLEVKNEKELKAPNFEKEEKITGAQKGTLMHLCIKNLNEKKDYKLKDIIELIKELKSKNIITEKEAQNINAETLLQFTKSNLFKDLKEAKEVHKEEPFYINIPASEIYNVQVEENVLVQGIIDLYYINKQGRIILVDYKTDYVQNENELIEKYSLQLELYKKALEGALKKQVEKVIIYSTYLQKEIIVV